MKEIKLTSYTVKGFAELIKEDADIMQMIMWECSRMSGTNKPLENVKNYINKVKNIKEENKDIIIKYMYANIFNRYDHRFYDTRGYSVTLRG